MKINSTREQVVNVCVGSLSNLSLNANFKQHIGKLNYVIPALKIMNSKLNELSVARTAAGLLANLGVDTRIANIIVEFGAVGTLANMLKNNFNNEIFQRNVVVALNNILTSNLSIKQSVRHQIVEKLFQIKESNDSFEVNSLIINCLVALGADIIEPTTSFHLAAKHGFTKILHTIVKEANELEDYEVDFEMTDGTQKTMMELAFENDRVECVEFLTQCGAEFDDDILDHASDTVRVRVEKAKSTRKEIREEYKRAIAEASPMSVPDLNGMVLKNLSDYSMAEGKHKF